MTKERQLSLKNNGNPMKELKKRTGIFSLKKSDKGFTLMETMIYIALFGIIMSGAVVGTYNLLEGGNHNVLNSAVEEEGTFLNRKISWALRGATIASVSGSGSVLTITRPDLGAQSPLIISGNGTNMTIARGVGVAILLNSSRFKVSNVIFTYIASLNGRPPSVSGNFMVENKAFTFRDYLRQ